MKVTSLKIPDVKLIEPKVFNDERGYFFEAFNQKKINQILGIDVNFVQDNHSKSREGVLRGLHYQEAPFAQGKLVRVISGEVYDVALDIRKNSITNGNWVSHILSGQNKKQLWIPPGFAHGFLTLSKNAEFLYKVTNFYSKKHERIINFDDKFFDIKWPKNNKIILSSKDNFK